MLSVHEELRLPAPPRDVFHADEHEVIQAEVAIANSPHSVAVRGTSSARTLPVLYNPLAPVQEA